MIGLGTNTGLDASLSFSGLEVTAITLDHNVSLQPVPRKKRIYRLRIKKILSPTCECGKLKELRIEACADCLALDGGGYVSHVVAALRVLDGEASVADLAREMGRSSRQVLRVIPHALAQGFIALKDCALDTGRRNVWMLIRPFRVKVGVTNVDDD